MYTPSRLVISFCRHVNKFGSVGNFLNMSSQSGFPPTFIKDFHDEEACRRMEYRPFGSTGLQVSKIALGGGTLSSLFGYVMYKYVYKIICLSDN